MLGRADVTGCVEAMRGAFPGIPERTLRQFSADWRYDFKRSEAALIASLKWREETLPRAPGPEGSDGATAAARLFTHRGFDHAGRAVFLYHGSRFAPKKWSADAVMLGVVHTLETGFAAADARDPDNDGTAVIILYLDRGSKLDMDLAKRFGRTVGAHYPGRAHKALIYPGTPLASRLWSVAKLFFSSEVREMVLIVKEKREGRATFATYLPEETLALLGIDAWHNAPWATPEAVPLPAGRQAVDAIATATATATAIVDATDPGREPRPLASAATGASESPGERQPVGPEGAEEAAEEAAAAAAGGEEGTATSGACPRVSLQSPDSPDAPPPAEISCIVAQGALEGAASAAGQRGGVQRGGEASLGWRCDITGAYFATFEEADACERRSRLAWFRFATGRELVDLARELVTTPAEAEEVEALLARVQARRVIEALRERLQQRRREPGQVVEALRGRQEEPRREQKPARRSSSLGSAEGSELEVVAPPRATKPPDRLHKLGFDNNVLEITDSVTGKSHRVDALTGLVIG